MSLPSPLDNVEKLQNALHVKAKAEPNYRFYSLWDKIFRSDFLELAYGRCFNNKGVPGVDGESFKDIEEQGRERWLGKLQEELRTRQYKPRSLLRVWIPKATGGKRPLGIACIRDRVVMLAATLILEPIFEVDLHENQYGFRRGLDAKMALRRVFYNITAHKRTEIIDGDLSDYFGSIPHGDLLRCVSRRITDGQLLSIVKLWLEMPVIERDDGQDKRTTEAKDRHRGIPQGSPCSPLLSNLYFRRFMLAWTKFGFAEKFHSKVINYADDFVICSKPGNGRQTMDQMHNLMNRIGLQINEVKTKYVTLPEGKFDFLGYTFGRFYGKGGKPFIGTKPSKRSFKRITQKIHDETSRQWGFSTPKIRVAKLNSVVQGWANYFNQGPVLPFYERIQKYLNRRMKQWLARKHKIQGSRYRQYPDEYLYTKLGLIRLPRNRAELSRAKT